MIVSIYKEEVDNLDMQYKVNNFIKNGDVKLENVPRWGESKADIWVQVTISLMTMTNFILKIKTSFEAYKRYIYIHIQ